MTNVRAVAVGIPDRLKDSLGGMDGMVVVPDLVTAAGVLDDWPRAYVLYGEDLFGAAVTGMPVFLFDEQPDDWQRRVMVIVDANPGKVDDLAWDDARRLVGQAAVRLRARRIVDLSEPAAWESLDKILNEPVDTPN